MKIVEFVLLERQSERYICIPWMWIFEDNRVVCFGKNQVASAVVFLKGDFWFGRVSSLVALRL